MAPKACNEQIHDFSSAVIGPDANGVSSDSSNNKFPPVHPITIPNIPAVKLTERREKSQSIIKKDGVKFAHNWMTPNTLSFSFLLLTIN